MLIQITSAELDFDGEEVSIRQQQHLTQMASRTILNVESEDDIADALSDQCNFCVKSFTYDILPEVGQEPKEIVSTYVPPAEVSTEPTQGT